MVVPTAILNLGWRSCGGVVSVAVAVGVVVVVVVVVVLFGAVVLVAVVGVLRLLMLYACFSLTPSIPSLSVIHDFIGCPF